MIPEYMCPFAARPSHVITLHSWKLKRLLDRVDNQRTMHDSQNDALEWVCGNRNDAHYCGAAMLHGLYIPLSSCVDSHLALLHFLLRVFLLLYSINHNGRQEGNQASSLSVEGVLFFAQQCLYTTAGAIRISATTRVPVGGLLSPLALASLLAGRALREDPSGGYFFG
jgi:hypothetical protein